MLERDPKSRISAETALKHPFFNNEMDVEMPLKEVKASLHETKHSSGKRQEVETPTQVSKISERNAYFDFGKREVKPYFYS